MAKIGLNYGEKLQIADKTYRVITDGLNVPEVLENYLSVALKALISSLKKTVPNATLMAQSSKSTQEKSVGLLSQFTLLSKDEPSFSPLLIWLSLKSKT